MSDYRPLASGDPFPADPVALRAYGDSLVRTGALIAESVELLRHCADDANWSTDTADAFVEKSGEVADEIDKAHGRFAAVGARLRHVADTLAEAERLAAGHAEQARHHVADASRHVEQPGTDPTGAPAPLTPEQVAANTRRQGALDEIARLQRRFDEQVEHAREAADAAARAVRGELDDDVQDGWWDRNAGWLKTVTQVLGAIALAAAVVMLTVATGGTIWLVALAVAATAGALSLAIHTGLAGTGNGSWWDVAFDAVGLLTLGAGGLLTKGLAATFPALRSGFTAFRGAQAFDEAFSGLRLTLGNALSRIPFGPLARAGQRLVADLADDAAAAAAAARAAAQTAPDVGRLPAFLLGGKGTASELAHARQMLEALRAATGLPTHLVADATRLGDDAARVVRDYQKLVLTTGIGTVNGVAQTVHGVYDGIDLEDLESLGSYGQFALDILGRLAR